MHPYSDAQLNYDLTEFIYKIGRTGDNYRYLFNMLHLLGFRFNEVKAINRWIFHGNNVIEIPLSKGQSTRTIILFPVEYDIYLDIFNSSDQFSYVNQSTAGLIMSNYLKKEIVLNTGKHLKTHLFRHNYIKILKNEGLSIEQIAISIGEINYNNVAGYVNSQLFVL